MKNVVVCCDGTANEFARDNTNVVKLFSTLVQEPARQVAYYHPGLGTMEPAGALTTPARHVTKLVGRAFGYGLEADIRDAYVFLMNAFEEGDRVFLFGFSRGAYTVRAVASLLHLYGLIRKGDEALVPYAIRMMTAIGKRARGASGRPLRGASPKRHDPNEGFRLADRFRATFSIDMPCAPWFVGVWDTVSSVGWIENPLVVPFSANNPDIRIGRHAISIDERRAFFRQNLWRSSNPPSSAASQDLKQVWFPGVHCDVGGGYLEAECGLSKLALQWMLREAEAAELLIDHDKVDLILGKRGGGYAVPDAGARMHESLEGWWRLAEFIPKRRYDWAAGQWVVRMNLFRRRTIPNHASVHESAYERGEDYARRLPATAVHVD